MPDKIKALYDAVSKKYNVGTLDEFSLKLQDESKRKAFYDVASNDFNLGDFNSFSNNVKKKDQPTASLSGGKTSSTGSEPFQQFNPKSANPYVNQKAYQKQADESGIALNPNVSKGQGKQNKKVQFNPELYKAPSGQELYNRGQLEWKNIKEAEDKAAQEVVAKQAELSLKNGPSEDESNYYYNGNIFPKSDYTKYQNTLIKRREFGSPTDPNTWLAGFNEFRNATMQFVTKPLAGAMQVIRDLPVVKDVSESLYQGTGYDPLASAIKSLNDFSDISEATLAMRGGLPESNIAKPILHAAPVILATMATGGLAAGEAGAASLAAETAANVEALAGRSIFSAAKNAVSTPLVKTLSAQEGLSAYGQARKSGASTSEATSAAIKGAAQGAGSAVLLETQGAIANRVTKDFMKSIYTADLGKSAAKNAEGIVGSLNTGLVFGATPVVNDLIVGNIPDLDKAAHEFAVGAAFHAPQVIESAYNISSTPFNKFKLDRNIFQTAITSLNESGNGPKVSMSPREIGDLTKLTLENNALSNFFSAKPEAIDIANQIPETHQKLFESSLDAGKKAYDSNDLAEKSALHVEQLTLQKASDIKYVTDAILKNKDAFLDAIDKMDIPESQKREYKDRIDYVYENYSESGRVNSLFNDTITSLQSEVETLSNKVKSETVPSKKAELVVDLEKKQAQLEDLTNQLTEFTRIDKDRKERALNESQTNMQIDEFVDRIKSGEDMNSPEDAAFYEKNKNKIQKKLEEYAVQEPSTTSEVSPVAEGGKNLQESGEGVGPGIEGKEVAQAIEPQKEVAKAEDIIAQLETARGKQAKTDLVNKLKSVTLPEEFDAFLEENPKYSKYVTEEPSRLEVTEEAQPTEVVFNAAKNKAIEAISEYKRGLVEGKEVEKEKSQALQDITNGLREEISAQLRDAKNGPLAGGKVSAVTARRLLDKVNKAKTPSQLLNAIDYVEKHMKDIEYGNKLDEVKRLSASVKKLAKNAPLNIRISLESLAKSNPKEIKDVDSFIYSMSEAEQFLKQNQSEGINQNDILRLSESIQKNNLKSKIDRASDILARKMVDPELASQIASARETELSGVKDRAERKAINDKYDVQMDALVQKAKDSIKKPLSDSIKEMKESLDELNGEIGFLSNPAEDLGETGSSKRESMEAINEVLRADLSNTDTSDLSQKQKSLVEAMENIDTSKLTDKQLKFLNYAIDNFTENGAFDGVGQYIYNQYKIQKNFTPDVIAKLQKTALGLNAFKKAAFTRTSVDAFFNSAFTNERSVAEFRVATGFGDWSSSYGSKRGFKGRLETDMDSIHEIAKKTGINENPESQIKIGAVADITQHERGLTEAQVQAEFEGRKAAMAESIARGKETAAKSKEWRDENGSNLDMVELVYNKYVKDSATPSELISKLNNGEITLLNAMKFKFDAIKEGQRELSEIHKNEPFNDVENYFPRTYTPLAKAKTGEVESVDLTDSSGFRVRENLDKTKSTAFEERVLKGSQVRKNHMVNYNILDTFQNEYRRQLYDYYTYEHRQFAAQAVSSKEMLESLNGDLDMLHYLQQSFGNRYLNEVRGLQAAKSLSTGGEIWNLMRNAVVRDALGGVGVPFIKQYAPTFASMVTNAGETTWSSISILTNSKNKDAFEKLIANSPVGLRHKQEIALTGGLISAKDLKDVTKGLKKGVRWLNDVSDKVLMTALKQGDVSSAGLAYLAYYQKALLESGKIKSVSEFDIQKEAANPDKYAQQYAEQMTATTLNINEAVNKPVDASIPLLGANMPFTSFAMNSKINMMNNIGKLFESKGVMSAKERVEALQRIGSGISEAFVINAVGWSMRALSYGAGYSLFSYALSQSDMDEKAKNKALDVLTHVFDNKIKTNDANYWKYVGNDILFGQIGENYVRPLANTVAEEYNTVMSEGEVNKKTIYSGTEMAAALLSTRGYAGAMALKSLKYVKDFNDMLTYYNEPKFRMNKFGYLDAYGNRAIPYAEQNTKVPEINQYMQSLSVVASTFGLVTGTPKELQDFTRNMPSINRSILTELYGKDKNVVSVSKRYESMEPVEYNGKQYYDKDDYSVIDYADKKYILTKEQLNERLLFKKEFLDGVYTKLMAEGVQGAEAKKKVLEKMIDKYPESVAISDQLKELKYTDKYMNGTIGDIADIISLNRIIRKYRNKQTGDINLTLQSEVKGK